MNSLCDTVLVVACAVAASVVGLVLLLYPSNHSCHGQVVTLLYIGGASSTSGLLSCQETDGAGETWQHFLWVGGLSNRVRYIHKEPAGVQSFDVCFNLFQKGMSEK